MKLTMKVILTVIVLSALLCACGGGGGGGKSLELPPVSPVSGEPTVPIAAILSALIDDYVWEGNYMGNPQGPYDGEIQQIGDTQVRLTLASSIIEFDVRDAEPTHASMDVDTPWWTIPGVSLTDVITGPAGYGYELQVNLEDGTVRFVRVYPAEGPLEELIVLGGTRLSAISAVIEPFMLGSFTWEGFYHGDRYGPEAIPLGPYDGEIQQISSTRVQLRLYALLPISSITQFDVRDKEEVAGLLWKIPKGYLSPAPSFYSFSLAAKPDETLIFEQVFFRDGELIECYRLVGVRQ